MKKMMSLMPLVLALLYSGATFAQQTCFGINDCKQSTNCQSIYNQKKKNNLSVHYYCDRGMSIPLGNCYVESAKYWILSKEITTPC